MLHIAVCDDDIEELERTCGLIREFLELKGRPSEGLRRFQSGYDLMDCIEHRSGFDLYLLDIIMPVSNGIELGKAIKEKNENAIIIYTTSSEEFAVRSYRVGAFDYLVKPFGPEELFPVLERAVEKLELESILAFPVKTHQGIRVVYPRQIMYAEARNRCCVYHLSDGSSVESVSIRKSFSAAIAHLLEEDRFVRCGASFAVNLDYVEAITVEGFVMRNGQTVPISRVRYAELKKLLMTYLLRGER